MSTSNQTPPLFVSDVEVAKAIGMSVYWVRKDRLTNRVLPFFRLGRAVRYNLADVKAALVEASRKGDL